MSDLPSLNALRAFEAAARRGSMKEAAAELYVTPGAVSQQIKGLEEALGSPLFRRLSRGLELTEAGAALYPVLREAFQRMAAAWEALGSRERSGPLTVSVVPSFAAKWLVPRLGRFRERHPDIDVRLSATDRLVDFEREDVDVAIRHGLGHYPGLRSEWLLAEDLYPVCSPALLAGPRPLRRPEDLRHQPLLHDESPREWRLWLEVHGVEGVEAGRGPIFSDAAMALQAAVDGQGVALARGELSAEDVQAGRLVRPFDLGIPNAFAYYVVCPPARAEWPKVAAFREWILGEARGERQAGTARRPRRAAPARRPAGRRRGPDAAG